MNTTEITPLEAALYVVATPIGNLGDLSPRAAAILRQVDLIAAEDTRSTRQLLSLLGEKAPELISAHAHNERQAAVRVCRMIEAGKACALVSDAGTPAVSDPGARLVAAVQAAGHRVVPIPGPSAVLALLSAAGIDADRFGEGAGRFLFQGFLPTKAGARERLLRQLSGLEVTLVFLEAPHRIGSMLAALALVFGAGRHLVIGRELTKRFEQVVTLPAGEALAWLERDPNHQRGEFVVAVAPAAPSPDPAGEAGPRWHEPATCALSLDDLLRQLMAQMPMSGAARLGRQITGLHHRLLYERMLALSEAGPAEPSE